MTSAQIMVTYGDKPRLMVKQLLEQITPEQGLDQNALIGIKPNLVVPKPHTSGATTSPEIVAGIIEYFQAKGYRRIIILEGSWVGARTAEAFKICGYQDLAQTYGVPLIDLQQDKFQPYEAGGLQINVCRQAMAVDYLINVPVLKGHCQTIMTCALKNLKGCIPNAEKRKFHSLGLHKPIACLNKIRKQQLIIVDGLMGDLDFEEGGNPVRMNRIMAGTDPVLIDSYGAQLLGFDPKEIAYIGLAQQLGVGRIYQETDQIIELNRDAKLSQPAARTGKVRALARHIADRDACSACYGSLIHALARLQEQIYIGQGYRNQVINGAGVGACTRGCKSHLDGCPPTAKAMLEFLRKI
jgi:uncharacterized protein (DUF362 family)